MKFKVFAILLYSLVSRADLVPDYNYAITDPLKSTVSSAKIEAPKAANHRVIKLKLFDRRENRARRDLKVNFFPVVASHKLVVILSGLGGNAESPTSEYIASYFQTLGASALIIPNSMTEEFVFGASQTGIVGDINNDATDIYTVMQVAVGELASEGIAFSNVSLVGYSLGALLASRVAEIDYRERRVGISSTLLVNPPVNLLPGMRLLDSYYAQFKSMGLGSLLKLLNVIKKFFAMIVHSPADASEMPISQKDLQAAIGQGMRQNFAKMVYATQEIHDLKILPDVEEERLSATKNIGFEDYVTKFLLPALAESNSPVSLNELNVETGLEIQKTFLESALNVFVLHNADDILLHSEDIDWIERTFHHRARIYPRGGHLGNLNHPDNLNAIQNWLLGKPIN